MVVSFRLVGMVGMVPGVFGHGVMHVVGFECLLKR